MPVLLWLEVVPIELVLLGDVVLGDVLLVLDPIWPVELELLLGVWVLLLEVLLLCATIIVANSSATSTTTIERIRIQTPGVKYWRHSDRFTRHSGSCPTSGVAEPQQLTFFLAFAQSFTRGRASAPRLAQIEKARRKRALDQGRRRAYTPAMTACFSRRHA